MKTKICSNGFLQIDPETELEEHILTWWCAKNVLGTNWPNLVINTKLPKSEHGVELED